MKKIFVFIGILILSILTLNVRIFASNSYYLMSCTEQNIPNGYYANVDTTSEATMRESLCNIISTNYVGGSYNKAWDIDVYADADPYNQGYVQCVYTGQTVANDIHGASGWEREHIWCKSHGFKGKTSGGGDRVSDNNAYSDCHHLRAASHTANNTRSDKDFGELDSYTGSDEYGNKWTSTIYEPRDESKGDIARMLFYMMIRYGEYSKDFFKTYIDGVDTEVKYNLELVDEDTTTTSTGNGRLGKLSTLLKWHYEDPVSDREIYRNNVVYLYQKNRNPFIDHPEYVDIAFENSYGPYEAPTSTPVEPDDTPRTDSLVKTIGFEAEEGFEATSTYNSIYKSGNDGEQWNVYYGTAATSNALSGSQSMQMRWYTNSPDVIPCCSMDYDINNLSRVEFTAKGIANSKVAVVYSYDQGKTWITNEEINLTTTKKTYSSTISENGGYGDLRIGFKMILPETKPTSTSNFYIDDVKLYRGKDSSGVEFAKENTKANLKLKYDESFVTTTQTYFEKVTNLSELTDGSEFIIATYDINTYPYSIGTYSSNRLYGLPVTVREDRLYIDNPTTLTLESGSVENTYAIKKGTKYIGNNDTGTNNYIKELNTIDVNTSWNISIDETGIASVILAEDSSNTKKKRVLSFNTSVSGGVTNYYFCCYGGKQKSEVAFYKKVTKQVTEAVYTYNETYLRFVGLMGNELYQDILTEDTNAEFGIALSKDGTLYTNYECVVTKANLVDGVLVDTEDGTYAYFALKLLTPKEHFTDLVYAKAYVIINGNTYYMSVSNYSVESLVNYYLNNITLTQAQIDLVGGLVK